MPARRKLLLLQPLLGDQPAPERAGRKDHGAGDKCTSSGLPMSSLWALGTRMKSVRAERLLRHRAVGIAEPGAGEDDDAVRRGQAVEFVAEPFDLDLAGGGRRRGNLALQLLGEAAGAAKRKANTSVATVRRSMAVPFSVAAEFGGQIRRDKPRVRAPTSLAASLRAKERGHALPAPGLQLESGLGPLILLVPKELGDDRRRLQNADAVVAAVSAGAAEIHRSGAGHGRCCSASAYSTVSPGWRRSARPGRKAMSAWCRTRLDRFGLDIVLRRLASGSSPAPFS